MDGIGYKQISFDSTFHLRTVTDGTQNSLIDGDYLMLTKWIGSVTKYHILKCVDGELIELDMEESGKLRLTVRLKYHPIYRWLATRSPDPRPTSFRRSCATVVTPSFGRLYDSYITS